MTRRIVTALLACVAVVGGNAVLAGLLFDDINHPLYPVWLVYCFLAGAAAGLWGIRHIMKDR